MKSGIIHFVGLTALLGTGIAARAQDTNTNAVASPAPPRMTLRSFQLIETRNIFDPNRRPARVVRDQGPRDTIEYFGLSGAITYENQAYALFDGSGQVRNRAFKPADKINGYTIAAITNNTVKLDAGSNQVVTLIPGMQMRRVNNGPWKLVPSSVPAPDTSSSGSSTDSSADGGATTASGPEADVIAKLMKRRAEENKDQSAGSTGSTGEGTGTNEIH